MDNESATELLQCMEDHVTYFAEMATDKAEQFGPELRVARKVTERLRSGEFVAEQVAKEINGIDDHYDGHSWWCFLNCVAEFLALPGREWEVGVWLVNIDPFKIATVIIPLSPRIDVDGSSRQALLEHLSQVLLPQFRDLAGAHGRFAEAYRAAGGIVERLLHGDLRSLSLDDAGLSSRLGWLRSDEFLSCARAYVASSM